MRALCLLLLPALLLGCTSAECKPENLPHQGVVLAGDDDAHFLQLFELLQYAAREDCCETLYANLSAASRAEHSETTFCLFWEDIELPEPYFYELGDIVRDGEFTGTFPGPQEGETFAYVSYPPTTGSSKIPKGPNLLAQILITEETDEQGRRVPRLALMEQFNRLEKGDSRYTWEAGR